VELTSLKLMREKGVISQAEYDSALKDIGQTAGPRAGDNLTFVLGKFSTTFYGFIDTSFIYDSTQSLGDVAGNAPIARPGTYAGEHGRLTFTVRASRFGFRIAAPEYHGVRASAVLEADFFGPALPTGVGQPGTEAAVFSNPALRVRQAYFKVETPVVDILVGQTWMLLGWGAGYLLPTIEYPGQPGELFGRTPQFRLSKTVKGEVATFEIAAAAMRPVQRDSANPEVDGGIRFAINKWNATQSINAVQRQVSPISVAVTGNVRRVILPDFTANPMNLNRRGKTGNAIAVDAFLPVIPTPKGKTGDSFAVTGEFAYGKGIADRYTALVGGVSNPALPNPDPDGDGPKMPANPAPVFDPKIDPGIAVYDAKSQLQLVQWTSFNVGAQYFIHGLNGRLWLTGNYARIHSNNAANLLGGPVTAGAFDPKRKAAVWDTKEWFDVNVIGDPLPFVRFGLGFGRFRDTYVDGTQATNYRGQFSGWLFF
jgi:hypothetical protein